VAAGQRLGKALMIASVLLVIIVELSTRPRGHRRPHLPRPAPPGQARQGHRQRAVFVALVNVLVVWGLILFA
jgi:hypothetical protein